MQTFAIVINKYNCFMFTLLMTFQEVGTQSKMPTKEPHVHVFTWRTWHNNNNKFI